nr:mitochondrial dicarboxylate carrier [Drosophila bipectinata]
MSSHDPDRPRKKKYRQINFIEGFIMNFAATLLTHPLELVRINMQAKTLKVPPVKLPQILKLILSSGPAGFYFGFHSAAVRCGVQTTATYFVYHRLTDHKYIQRLKVYDTISVHGVCNFVGGLIATPFAKLAVMRQTDLSRKIYSKRNYKNTWRSLRCIYLKGGFAYVFYGWQIYSICNATRAMLWFPVNKLVMSGLEYIQDFRGKQFLHEISAMSVTGSLLAFLFTPLDILVTLSLNCTSYRGAPLWAICRTIFKRRGYKGFFLGGKFSMVTLMLHSVLVSTLVHTIHDI